MAREIAAASKSSSLRFDGESDEEENTGSHGQSSKAVARPSNVAKDTSGLFVKDDEPIGFYVADKEISRSIVVRLEQQIGECGGEFLSKSPVEGYVLVDTRTEGGANYISSRSTATRRVVSYLFVQESISRGKIVPYSELILFIKEDRPVMFHLHKSLGEDESERLRDAIMLRGGNPDATLRTAQVLIHADDWPNKALVARKHQGIALFETVQWLEACIRTKRFSLSSRGGTIPKPVKAPGRKPGAPRTDYTPDDDKRLIGWMAHYFGKSMVGRAGNRPYQLMTEHPQCASWAHRHTWQSWRERYKNRKSHFDPLIEAHLAKHPAVKPNDAESFVVDDELDTDDELETGDDESDTDDSGTPGPAPRPKRKTRDSSSTPGRSSGPKAPEGKETRPSKKAKTIRPAPKKVQEDEEEAEEEEDGEEEEEPVVQTKVSASQRAAKSQHPQPNKKGKASPTPERDDHDHEDIQSKYFTSQRPSKLHPPPTPPLGPPPFSPAEQGSHRRESGPGLPPQDASDPVGVDDSLDESQDSIQMTPPFGILEISANVQDEVNRLNAELATVEQQPQISDEEVDELEDPDVDVVGVTQVETPPGSPMVRDEDGYEGTPEDAGGTEIENLSIQLHQLADEFSVSLDRVKSAYEAIAPDLDEREALDSLRREFKKSRKARRGKAHVIMSSHKEEVTADKCPVDHTNSEAWANLTPPSWHPPVPGTRASNNTSLPPSLPRERETSSIPRIDGQNWVYPSEAQFFAAMARKNHNPHAPDMRVIVPIHNAVNEKAWSQLLTWEAGRGADACGGVKLVSFKGRPGDRTPKAWFKTLIGYQAPFDRHDWVIDRCGTRMRYVIDFYTGRSPSPSVGSSGPMHSSQPNVSFYLDVRPAIDNWEGLKMRLERAWTDLTGWNVS